MKVKKVYGAVISAKSLRINPQSKEDNETRTIHIDDGRLLTYSEYIFSYSYNVPFTAYIDNDKKKGKINTEIEYKHPETQFKSEYYTRLNSIQKVKNSFIFNKLWIQQPNNIMWIVNILIAILVCIVAFLEIFKMDH